MQEATYIRCNDFEVYVIIGPVFHLHAEPMREWNKNALIFFRGDLKLHVNVKESGMLDMLAIPTPLGFLNQPEMQIIKSLPNEMDRMDKIIDFLLGKEDNCFSKFCDSLEKSNNRTWATDLKMKAEEFKRGSGKIFTYCPCTQKYMSCEHFYISICTGVYVYGILQYKRICIHALDWVLGCYIVLDSLCVMKSDAMYLAPVCLG